MNPALLLLAQVDFQLSIQGPIGKGLLIAFVCWLLLCAIEDFPAPEGPVATLLKISRVLIVVTACLLILFLPF